MAYYKISAQTLTAIADAVRSKIGTEEEIPCAELAEAIASIDIGEVVLESAGVAFSSQKVDPDVNYKVGRNWLADLVSVVQKMAGKKSDMTLEDMIYWLNRVLFIPQGNAESSFSLSFSSSASGILPDVQIGTAGSAFTLSFSSESSGRILPELNGAKVSYNGVTLPGIPEEMFTYFPYAWIRKNVTTGYYELIFSELQPWYSASNKAIQYGSGSGPCVYYGVAIDGSDTADAWEAKEALTTSFGLDDNRTVLWSNHDIPRDSATGTEVYFAGSEPVAVTEE